MNTRKTKNKTPPKEQRQTSSYGVDPAISPPNDIGQRRQCQSAKTPTPAINQKSTAEPPEQKAIEPKPKISKSKVAQKKQGIHDEAPRPQKTRQMLPP